MMRRSEAEQQPEQGVALLLFCFWSGSSEQCGPRWPAALPGAPL